MTFNLVIAVLALGLSSGFPRPDLVSVDIGSIQAGAGLISYYDSGPLLFPDAGLSIGQARAYWGKKIGVLTGLELLQVTASKTDNPGLFVTSEFLMPQAGVSFLFGHERQFKTGKGFLGSRGYIPRLDIVLGVTPFNLVLWETSPTYLSFSPTLKTEISFHITHSLQVLFENQNMPEYDTARGSWWPSTHTYHFALCFALGADYVNSNEEE